MKSGKRQIVLVDMKFPDNFPIDAPTISFKTRIQHPSINEYGIAKLSIINAENWTPNIKIRDGKHEQNYFTYHLCHHIFF